MSPCKRHRHFVVLPLFLLLFAASTTAGISSAGALTHSTSFTLSAVEGLRVCASAALPRCLTASVIEQQEVKFLSGGIQVKLGEGAVVETDGPVPSLTRGSALFHADGIGQVQTPRGHILLLAGATHVIVHGSAVTVSAITAPVLLSVNGRLALIPVGSQFQVPEELPGTEAGYAVWVKPRATAPLPDHFLRDQLLALRTFPPGEWLPERQAALPSATSAPSSLELHAAQERRSEAWRTSVLGALRLRVEQGVEEGAQQVLRHPSYEAALADPQSLSVLVALAARADADSSLRPLLLKFLLPRHDLWLLAALHPKLQSGAWTITIPALTPEERAILAFGLPASDREPEGFSPIVLQWWAEDIERLIGEQREPAAFVSTLLQVHLPLVEEYQALGYPERAQILAQSLASFAEPVRSSLTPDLQKSLGEMQAIAAPRFILMDSPMSSSSAAASPPAPLPSVPLSPPGEGRSVSLEERVGIVEAMLEQAGALFTTQAKFDPLDDGRSVHVSGILFASSRGDRSYEFDVDTVANEVSSIVQDGKTMPYPMGFDAFLEWVRK